MIEHIITEIEDNYIIITTEVGYWLTQYNEIKGDFYATKKIFIPLDYSLEQNGWRIITQEEYERFIDERDNIKINNEG